MPKFSSELGFSRKTLVPDANHFPSLRVGVAMLPCWTWGILTFSALSTFSAFSTLPAGVARLARISNLPRRPLLP